MVEKYAPKQEIINFLEKGLRTFERRKLDECLSTLSKGELKNLPQIVNEVKKGSPIGMAFYNIIEQLYYNRYYDLAENFHLVKDVKV